VFPTGREYRSRPVYGLRATSNVAV
jgi:hypothetical protein